MSPERTVYLIDTPGFDGTNKNDTEVLSEVATWLADSYQSKIRLHGIIFLHRITDNRLQGSAKRTLAMLRKLCGPTRSRESFSSPPCGTRPPRERLLSPVGSC